MVEKYKDLQYYMYVQSFLSNNARKSHLCKVFMLTVIIKYSDKTYLCKVFMLTVIIKYSDKTF